MWQIKRVSGLSLLAALVAVFLCSCAYTPEITVLLGSRTVNGSTDTGGFVMVAQRFGGHGICAWTHSSNPAKGQPFNDEFDVSADLRGCGWRWGGNDRLRGHRSDDRGPGPTTLRTSNQWLSENGQ